MAILIVKPYLLAPLIHYSNAAVAQFPRPEDAVQLVPFIAIRRADGHRRSRTDRANSFQSRQVIACDLDSDAVPIGDRWTVRDVPGAARAEAGDRKNEATAPRNLAPIAAVALANSSANHLQARP